MLQNNKLDKVYVSIDEAGRGPLAGPVVCAAVIWNPLVEGDLLEEIKDSKKILSPSKREALYDFIIENAIDYSIIFIDNDVIDNINILEAVYLGMHRALDALDVNFDHILVDGNKFKKYKDVEHTCIVKGDAKMISIAAASILAKVARDRYMVDLAKIDCYARYFWRKNMGYGTKEHMDAIRKYGLTKYHRRSFKPCLSMV